MLGIPTLDWVDKKKTKLSALFFGMYPPPPCKNWLVSTMVKGGGGVGKVGGIRYVRYPNFGLG